MLPRTRKIAYWMLAIVTVFALAAGMPSLENPPRNLGIHDPGPVVPTWTPTYVMNSSTIIMPCNYTGWTDPATVAGWGIVDFDWSNAKAYWAQDKPMLCEERMLIQAQKVKWASPDTRVWVYRNSIKALPWFTSVRETLTDPAYAKWFINFKDGLNGTYHVPVCDKNYNPPLCSSYYHDQSQTPGFPSGDGNCAAPACDVGTVPVGEYIWDPRAANVSVNGMTLLDFLINHYALNIEGAGNDLIDGLFFDDEWDMNGPTEYEGHAVEDMGLSTSDLHDIVVAYTWIMSQLQAAVVKAGKFSWQLLYTDGSTCARPLVQKSSCAADLRAYCAAGSAAQTRAIMYGFSPGGCSGDPSQLVAFDEDLANFLLIRGPYAWLGHAWLGCSRHYAFPAALHADYGVPLGLCTETAPNSQVFVREWSKATVKMDCNSYSPTIIFK